MSAEPLMQALYGIINGTGSPVARRQFIGNFETFILNHIPYAQVRPRDLQTGLIEFDGPGAPGNEGKPSLVWHFGGLPHPISKAARLDYYYVRMWDGSGLNVHASILFGFQPNLPSLTINTAPRAQVNLANFAPAQNAQQFVKQISDTVAAVLKTQPTALVSGIDRFTDLDAFLQTQLGPNASPLTPAAAGSRNAPAVAGEGFTWNPANPQPIDIEFDGPARDNDSHQIFAYTGDTLFNDKEKFDQLLWWYFGGKALRMTKAMRIPLTDAVDAPSLFIGFTGPGSFP
jgi:hypothetical protein